MVYIIECIDKEDFEKNIGVYIIECMGGEDFKKL